MTIIAVREMESGRVVELREPTEAEMADGALTPDATLALLKQYPAPQYDMEIGIADSIEAFTTAYPRFAEGGGGTAPTPAGDATTETTEPTEGEE